MGYDEKTNVAWLRSITHLSSQLSTYRRKAIKLTTDNLKDVRSVIGAGLFCGYTRKNNRRRISQKAVRIKDACTHQTFRPYSLSISWLSSHLGIPRTTLRRYLSIAVAKYYIRVEKYTPERQDLIFLSKGMELKRSKGYRYERLKYSPKDAAYYISQPDQIIPGLVTIQKRKRW